MGYIRFGDRMSFVSEKSELTEVKNDREEATCLGMESIILI